MSSDPLRYHLRLRANTLAATSVRFDTAVEAAVYSCAADAERTLRHLQTCALYLHGSGRLRLTLAGLAGSPGSNGLTDRLRDRVEGRGGTLSKHRADDHTLWQLVIPTVRPS